MRLPTIVDDLTNCSVSGFVLWRCTFLSNRCILRIDRRKVTSIDLRVGEGICDFDVLCAILMVRGARLKQLSFQVKMR